VTRTHVWALLAALGVLVGITMPDLGSPAWPFDPPSVDPRGILGPLVRVADREWDLGILRSTAILAALVVALAAAATWRLRSWPRWAAIGLAGLVCAMLLVPAALLQVGLRDATEPWYFTNDSTYQIEIAGDLILDGDNPYGHDYGDSGLENFYPAADNEEAAFDRAARHNFAYFPGTALTAAAWRILPRPWDDYRLFVLLATLALLPAALLFPGPLHWRLAIGAALAANPLLVKAAWFGTADAPALLALVLSFALLVRGRPVWAGASLGAALALKQFALVAVPFLAVMLLLARVPRQTLYRAGAAFGGVFLATALPFLIADPGALWDDTVAYGADTYRIVGYGLAALLLNLGVLDDRFGYYPFVPLALVIWLPITAWLLWSQRRAGSAWAGAAGFTVSMFVLLFLSRVFQTSYLVWPLTGIALALLLASAARTSRAPSLSGASTSVPAE
jgi:drug/metabolite transporter superfamily protein YnfA